MKRTVEHDKLWHRNAVSEAPRVRTAGVHRIPFLQQIKGKKEEMGEKRARCRKTGKNTAQTEQNQANVYHSVSGCTFAW